MSDAAVFFDYSQVGYNIRPDLAKAHLEIWKNIAAPGSWWRGEDRVAIAAEVRNAGSCTFCQERKLALSAFSVQGAHNTDTHLPEVVVEAVHRVTTDASRLTKSWLSDCQSNGLSHEQYIELLGIVVAVISIDAFHRCLGIALEELPSPLAGEPSQYRPTSAQQESAWIPTIAASRADGDEADLYDGQKQTGNVLIAMSLVPDSVRMLKTLSSAQYLETRDVINPSRNGNRKISRAQMELLAGRVSALNDCFY